MNRFIASILTTALLLFPAAVTHADSHTNIPDTDKYVTNEIDSFTSFVNQPNLTNQQLSKALSDLEMLLETYQGILERRGGDD